MPIRRRRAGFGAAALLIAGVLAASGCSAAGTVGRPVPAASSVRTAMPALTVEQLKALTLKDSEVPQAHDAPVRVPEASGDQRTFPPVSDISCQKALDVLGARSASAVVFQIFNWRENINGGGSALASYDGVKAEEAFQQLKTSVATCKAYTGEGWVGAYSARVTLEPAPGVGDEALSFHLLTPMPNGGGTLDRHHVFVRVGNVTVLFDELEMDRSAQVPADVITKQIDRLRTSQPSQRP